MRILLDIVDSITGLIRFGIGAVMFMGLAVTLMLSAAIFYYTPSAEEKAAQEERMRELALKEKAMIEAEALRSQRDYALGQEGWGYESSDASATSFDASRENRRYSSRGGNDWGDSAR